ncbi:MAG: amidohydrolase family protein [Ferruginibacter sp.]
MKFFILFLLPLQSLSQQASILFKNVNVVDVQKGKVIPNQNVFVEGNRIKKISSKSIAVNGAMVVNGSGKYLIPGLCDFNASVLHCENEGVPAFKLMLANGVTSVRDLLPPNSPEEAFEIKKQIAAGKILAPRLFLSGKTLVDRKRTGGFEKGYAFVKTADEATAIVDSLINEGADVIDARNIRSDTILKAITKRAHQKGRKVMERMGGNWMKASNSGLDAFTHLSDLWRNTTTGRQKIFQNFEGDSIVSTQDFYNRVLPSLGGVDTNYFQALMHTLTLNNTWLCTGTTSYFQSIRRFEHGDTLRNVYRNKWQKDVLADDLKTQSTLTSEIVNSEKPDMSQLYMAHKAHIPIIAGTQLSGLLTSGMSLHDMLFWLVDGGLTPAEALRTATINPALFLNNQKNIGTIEAGKLADLVLLDANPLTDINNSRKINAVVANGKLLTRNDLDELLKQSKEQVLNK